MKSNNFMCSNPSGARKAKYQLHSISQTTKEHVGHEETKRRTKRRLTKIFNTNLDRLVPVYSLTDWWWWWQPHSYERQTALFL